MDSEEKEIDQNPPEWECSRCTFLNHPVDKKCNHCRAPHIIAYPNIPEELPVPDVVNPYPEKFMNAENAAAHVHTPKRKEVPPEIAMTTEPETVKDLERTEHTIAINPKTSNGLAAQNVVEVELEQMDQGLKLEDSSRSYEVPSSAKANDSESRPNLSLGGSSLLSNVSNENLYCGAQSNSLPPAENPGSREDDGGNDEGNGFLTPPLSGLEVGLGPQHTGDKFQLSPLPDFTVEKVTDPVTTDPSTSTIASSALPLKITRVDDFLEQSRMGFQKSDFRLSGATPQSNEFGNFAPMDLTVQNLLKPAQTNWNLTPMKPNLQPNAMSRDQTGSDVKEIQDLLYSNEGNQMEPAQSSAEWTYSPLDPILPPSRISTTNTMLGSTHLTHNLPGSDLRDMFAMGDTVLGPSPQSKRNLSSRPKKPLLTPESGVSSGTSNTKPSVKLPFQKIKPTKNSRPLDLGAKRVHRHSDENLPTEQFSEVASLRTAKVQPAAASASTVDLSDFDPYAPSQKPPLAFQEDHFIQESTVATSQGMTSTSTSTTSTTTTAVVGGARRKTPRTQTHTTMMTQTQPYAGPTTSRGPPLETMLIDGNQANWSCPLCTYANRMSAQYCEVCHDGRPPWYSEDAQNPITFPETPIGSIPNDRVLHETAPTMNPSKAFVDEWVCRCCTVSNQPNHAICQSCGNTRPIGFAAFEVLGAAPEVINTPSTSITQSSITEPKRMDVAGSSRLSTSQQFSTEELSSIATYSIGSSTTSAKVESITMEQLRRNQEKTALDVFKNIEKYCREADDKFVDDQFLPAIRSLQYPNGQDQNVRNAIWLRPHQVNCGSEIQHNLRWTVFCDEGPDSTDIQQGILGNCWFLSGLSVLVERPELLRKIFVTSEYNKFGVYMIRLCKDGVWQTVIIDDLLPCSPDGQLLYTQARRKQLWVPLIEKALAKVHGCYEALQAGRSIEGLATLTGAPCESLQLVKGPDQVEPDPDMIWAHLLSSKEAKFLMGASCGGANMDVNESIYEQVDLRVRHAYSVLDVRTEMLEGHGVVKLLQLRNPWAQQSWSGPWSDSDWRWDENPRMKAKLRPEHSRHGIFWISFEDMLRYFDSVDVCKTSDRELAEIRAEGDFPDSALVPPTSHFIEVYQSCEIDFSIFQQGSRSQEASGRHPVDLCICVFRSCEQAASSSPGSNVVLGPLVTCSRRQVKRHGSCFHFFEPGIYQIVILAFNHWKSAFGAFSQTPVVAENPKYVLALHSSRPISLSYFRANTAILADATIELVMKKGEKKEVRECATCYYLTRGWAGLIVVAENRHPTRFMQVVCDCVDSRNVVSTRGQLKTADSVPPLHKQVLIVLTQLDGHSGFTITHKLIHRMGFRGLGDWSALGGDNDPPLTEPVHALHQPRPL